MLISLTSYSNILFVYTIEIEHIYCSNTNFAFIIYRNTNLEEHIASIDTDLKSTSTDLFATREQLACYKAENRGLHEEMTVINQVTIPLQTNVN